MAKYHRLLPCRLQSVEMIPTPQKGGLRLRILQAFTYRLTGRSPRMDKEVDGSVVIDLRSPGKIEMTFRKCIFTCTEKILYRKVRRIQRHLSAVYSPPHPLDLLN